MPSPFPGAVTKRDLLFLGVGSRVRRAEGATFIELAITLPVFLFLLLGTVWLVQVVHARTTMTTTLGRAMRLAATRGNDTVVGKAVIPSIKRWRDTGTDEDKVLDLLVSNDAGFASKSAAKAPLLASARSIFGSLSDLRELPATYLYTLAYFYQSMEQELPGKVKHPCLPSGLNWSGWTNPPGTDTFGCTFCRFLNPSTISTGPFTGRPPSGFFAVQCAYQPDNFASRTLDAVGRVLGFDLASKTVLVRAHVYTSNVTSVPDDE